MDIVSIHHVYSQSCYPLYFIHFILGTHNLSVDMTVFFFMRISFIVFPFSARFRAASSSN